MSGLGRGDVWLVAVIGWCHRRLSPTARAWLAVELRAQEGRR